MNNGTCLYLHEKILKATTYMRSLSAGSHCCWNCGAMQAEHWVEPSPNWSATRFANGNGGKYTDTFGYGQLKTFNSTHLRFNFRPVSGNVKDAFGL